MQTLFLMPNHINTIMFPSNSYLPRGVAPSNSTLDFRRRKSKYALPCLIRFLRQDNICIRLNCLFCRNWLSWAVSFRRPRHPQIVPLAHTIPVVANLLNHIKSCRAIVMDSFITNFLHQSVVGLRKPHVVFEVKEILRSLQVTWLGGSFVSATQNCDTS